MAARSVSGYNRSNKLENGLIRDMDAAKLLLDRGSERLLQKLKEGIAQEKVVRCCKCHLIFPLSRTVPKSAHTLHDLSNVKLWCTGCYKIEQTSFYKKSSKTFGLKIEIVRFIAKVLVNSKLRKKENSQAGEDITLNYLCALWAKQRGLCAMSGLRMTINEVGNHLSERACLDRIDNTKGYERDNVQWTCFALNMMKLDTPQHEFFSWCQAVSTHQRKIVKIKKLTEGQYIL